MRCKIRFDYASSLSKLETCSLLHEIQLQVPSANNTISVPFFPSSCESPFLWYGHWYLLNWPSDDIVVYLGHLPCPIQSNWVEPSLDFKPWMVEYYWPTLANRYFTQNPFFSSGSPQDHISAVNSRPDLESASWPFSITVPSQKAMGLSIHWPISARKSCTCLPVPKEQKAICTLSSWCMAKSHKTV